MKKTLTYTVIASMIAMMFAISPVYAIGAIYAPTIEDPLATPGSTLVIDINVSDVTNLWGWEFALKFDPTILEPVKVYDRDLDLIPDSAITPEPMFEVPWGTPIVALGKVADAYSYPMGATEGFTTTEAKRIATVTFNVIAWGGSYLDLQETVLTNIPTLIDHNVVDGYFTNVIPDRVADLIAWKAKPEYRVWALSSHTSMSLYGRVKNLGNVALKVQAWFTVTDEAGLWRSDFPSGIYTLSPGEVKTLGTEPSIQPERLAGFGTYYVTAQAWYDSDGNGDIDTRGASTKSFKFVFKA